MSRQIEHGHPEQVDDAGVLDGLERHARGVQHRGQPGERGDGVREGAERARERREQTGAGAAGQPGGHRVERADARGSHR